MNVTGSRPALTPIKQSNLNIQASPFRKLTPGKPNDPQLSTPFCGVKTLGSKERAAKLKARLQKALIRLQDKDAKAASPETLHGPALSTFTTNGAPVHLTPLVKRAIDGELMALASSTPLPPSGLFTKQLSAAKRSVSFLDEPLLNSAETVQRAQRISSGGAGGAYERLSTYLKLKPLLRPAHALGSKPRAQISQEYFLAAAQAGDITAQPRRASKKALNRIYKKASPYHVPAQKMHSLATPATSTPENKDLPRLQLPSFAEITQRFESNLQYASKAANNQLPTPLAEKTSLPSLSAQFGSDFTLNNPMVMSKLGAARLPQFLETAKGVALPPLLGAERALYAQYQMITPVKKRSPCRERGSDDTIGESMILSSPTRLLTTPSSMGAARSLLQLAFPR
ncbi:hypothetical protein BABINDRAFT_159471 [Babjeviella inositovora NRRL Y-12698]|uniref:Uncharacterized protein n=1 Tax=Babjeviella inositovora NRRL Y-12698 TaxID=984486 RepID=A0A1E3QZ91_9ASCO|nr:uncharacterized protein BABINDRAFT_159471 [Babjeviella inositovora NRRL Y-12698]ODQ82993.1 hypothetical protein BABINDRAFT_159471 [Babjeviella inositovora NRRL Y-12698]